VQRLYYLDGNFDPNTYQRLQQQLTEIDQEHGTGGNYLYYLATSPEYFGKIVQQLGAGLTQEENGRWRRDY